MHSWICIFFHRPNTTKEGNLKKITYHRFEISRYFKEANKQILLKFLHN